MKLERLLLHKFVIIFSLSIAITIKEAAVEVAIV
jgi:hypothetical protein